MAHIIIKGAPFCPLCGNRMREVITRKGVLYICTEEWCMISIAKADPCCGRWQDKWPENAPKCPLCKKPMRWFFTARGFMKVQCRDESHKMVQIMKGKEEQLPPEFRGPLK